jgi:hypothetical protein
MKFPLMHHFSSSCYLPLYIQIVYLRPCFSLVRILLFSKLAGSSYKYKQNSCLPSMSRTVRQLEQFCELYRVVFGGLKEKKVFFWWGGGGGLNTIKHCVGAGVVNYSQIFAFRGEVFLGIEPKRKSTDGCIFFSTLSLLCLPRVK